MLGRGGRSPRARRRAACGNARARRGACARARRELRVLRVAVVHEASVQTERDVVQERAPADSATSTRRSGSRKAARAASGSSPSKPTSRAKAVRVPKGTGTKGTSSSAATRRRRAEAVLARYPDRVAPPSAASRASWARSSSGREGRVPIPCDLASTPETSTVGCRLPERGLTSRKPGQTGPRWRGRV